MRKKSINILIQEFCKNGIIVSSVVDTDGGVASLWTYAESQGWVLPALLPSPLGHKFSYSLTADGEFIIWESLEPCFNVEVKNL